MTDLEALQAAYALLPPALNSQQATLQCLAMRRQEAPNMEQVQGGGGPAHGVYQMEKSGGVRGVIRHPKAGPLARKACEALGIPFNEEAVYLALSLSGPKDVLDAVFARLFLYTDPKPLPAIGDEEAAWQCYLRTWRPGAYKRQPLVLRKKWTANYADARRALGV